MKTETLFASIFLSLLTCLPVALAAPIPGYSRLDEKPNPGHSGVHYDESKNEVHTYYGEKDMKKHMEHQMYNQRKHPENNRAFKAGPPGSTANRKKALAGVKEGPFANAAERKTSLAAVAKWKSFVKKKKLEPVRRVQDEKPHNSMVHDGKGVTVRNLPRIESSKQLFVWQFYLF
jgi:hypothetical protein